MRRFPSQLAAFSALLCGISLTACGSTEASPPQGDDAYVPPIEIGGEQDGALDGPALDGGESGGALDGDVGAPTSPVRSCKTVFSFAPGASVSSVEVAGEWNNFTKSAMTESGGVYRAELDLPKGDYGYKLVVGGNDWRLDPGHGRRKYVGGTENSRVIVPDCNVPELKVTKHVAKSDGTVEIDVQYVDGAEKKGLDPTSVIGRVSPTIPGQTTLTTSYDLVTGAIRLALKSVPKGKWTFSFEAKDKSGRAAKVAVPTWIEDEPFQWNDGTMYFVFTDRFRNGDPARDVPIANVDPIANYQGGDFAGVTKALEEGYFDKLGVRSLWLSPVNDNTNKSGSGTGGHQYSGYHGYWPTKARDTDDHFGSLDDLRTLIRTAHGRGIRVVLDLVSNQVHEDHEYVTSHKADGWFNGDGSCVCGGSNCSWDDRPVDCWFTSYLPDVNWASTGAQDAFIADSLWWLTEVDADGFRVDAVKHMNDVASTALRTEIREKLETGNAKYYLVGETFTGGGDGERGLIAKYIGPNALWGQFDFPLYWSVDYAFAGSGGTMKDLDDATAKSDTSYGPGALMSPFLGNHDVTRFLSRAAGQIAGNDQIGQAWTSPPPSPDADEPYERAFLAFAFVLTQPGVPLVYYGDEVGTPGTVDPDNRRFMKAEGALNTREKKLLDRVRLVAKARGTHLGLRRGARRKITTDGDGYVYARGSGDDVAVVVLNRGTTSRVVADVALPSELGLAAGTVLRDLLGGPSISVKAGGTIDVPYTARGASLYVR